MAKTHNKGSSNAFPMQMGKLKRKLMNNTIGGDAGSPVVDSSPPGSLGYLTLPKAPPWEGAPSRQSCIHPALYLSVYHRLVHSASTARSLHV
eukprot:2022476-Amphidinium_carterae.1